jgi:hypothetical protein
VKNHAMHRLLLGSVALGSLVSLSGISWGGPLIRLAAEFDYFGSEATTTLTPDTDRGAAIYRKTVSVPGTANTLYLTLSATGHTQNGATSCFSAFIDGNFFNPGPTAADCAGQQPGWIALQKLPGPDLFPPGTLCGTGGDGSTGPTDCLSNSISYQWCTAVTPGSHEVEIRMATGQEGNAVSINTAHFYVDAASLPAASRCVQVITPPAG